MCPNEKGNDSVQDGVDITHTQPSSQPLPSDKTVAVDAQVLEMARALMQQGVTPEQARRIWQEASASRTAPAGGITAIAESSASGLLSEMIAKKMEAQAELVKRIDLGLPDFREATDVEKYESEKLQREAELLRRRERYRDAEGKCREALQKNPKDAAGLELLGDILQGVGRVDEAMAAYYRATLADPQRASAEKKFGDLLVKQCDWQTVISEDVEKHPFVAILLSALLPGAGHIYYGQNLKGFIFVGIDILLLLLLLFVLPHRLHGGTSVFLGIGLIACLYYCYVLIDMRLASRREV